MIILLFLTGEIAVYWMDMVISPLFITNE